MYAVALSSFRPNASGGLARAAIRERAAVWQRAKGIPSYHHLVPMKAHPAVMAAVHESEKGLYAALGRLALEQVASRDPAIFRGWNKSVPGSQKVFWSGACSACGLLTSMPFKPLIGRDPPRCESCYSGKGQGQVPRSGLTISTSFMPLTGQGTQPTPERTTRLCVDALNFLSAAQIHICLQPMGLDSCAGSECTRLGQSAHALGTDCHSMKYSLQPCDFECAQDGFWTLL